MKLFKSFCGVIFIMVLFAVMNATAAPPGTDTWNSTGNNEAEFSADLYCVPTFTVSGVGGDAAGPYSYTQHLGNFYVGYVGTVDNLDIVFTLTGPGKYFDGTAIDYRVKVLEANTLSDDGGSIKAEWAISSANVNYSSGQVGDSWNFTGPEHGGYIHLNQESDNCQSYATFTITSLSIDLLNNWHTGVTLPATETFSFILEASVDI